MRHPSCRGATQALGIGGSMTNNHARRDRRTLLSSATAFTLISTAAAAQAAQPTQPTTGPQTRVNSDEIVITGTRRTDRTVTNSASPVAVVGAMELTPRPAAHTL